MDGVGDGDGKTAGGDDDSSASYSFLSSSTTDGFAGRAKKTPTKTQKPQQISKVNFCNFHPWNPK